MESSILRGNSICSVGNCFESFFCYEERHSFSDKGALFSTQAFRFVKAFVKIGQSSKVLGKFHQAGRSGNKTNNSTGAFLFKQYFQDGL